MDKHKNTALHRHYIRQTCFPETEFKELSKLLGDGVYKKQVHYKLQV